MESYQKNIIAIFILIIIVALAAGVAWWWSAGEKPAPTQEVSGEVSLPSVNPVENTNPFSDSYKNPFE